MPRFSGTRGRRRGPRHSEDPTSSGKPPGPPRPRDRQSHRRHGRRACGRSDRFRGSDIFPVCAARGREGARLQVRRKRAANSASLADMSDLRAGRMRRGQSRGRSGPDWRRSPAQGVDEEFELFACPPSGADEPCIALQRLRMGAEKWTGLVAAKELQVAALDEHSGVLDQARGLAASCRILPFDGRKRCLL